MPELPRPNAQSLANLNKISKKTGRQLQQIPIEKIMDYDSRYGYSCDEAGNLTGLNLYGCKIKDISFLTDFPRLTHLRLSYNQVADISPLQALTQLKKLYLQNNQVADLSPLQLFPSKSSPEVRKNFLVAF